LGDDLVFRVAANSLDAYLDFDPKRKGDLVKLHKLIGRQRRASSAIFMMERPLEKRVCA
jgi:hypothetical protein